MTWILHNVPLYTHISKIEFNGIVWCGGEWLEMKGNNIYCIFVFSNVISLSYRICLHDQNIIVVIIVIFQRH